MVHTFTVQGDHFAFDSVTGALHQLDEAALLVVERCRDHGGVVAPSDRDSDIGRALQSLIDRKRLFAPERTFHLTELYPDRPRIKAMCLNLCHDCNLRCTYCFAGTGDYGGPRGMMSTEVGRAAIDFLIAESGTRRHLDIDFFGGEPLMNWSVVQALVAYAEARERETGKTIRLTLTTNATLIDETKARFINAHFKNVVLSIDGRPDVHNAVRPGRGGAASYAATVRGIKTLLKTRSDALDHHVRGTFTHNNLDFASDVLALSELSTHVSIEPVVLPDGHPLALREDDLPRVLAEYERLAVALDARDAIGEGLDFFHFRMDLEHGPCAFKRHKGCGVGSEYIAVAPSGDIYPCHQFVGDTTMVMGSVLTGTIDRAVADPFVHLLSSPPQSCQGCFARPLCGGGCAANRCHRSHDVAGDDAFGCAILRRRAELSLWLYARRHARRLEGRKEPRYGRSSVSVQKA